MEEMAFPQTVGAVTAGGMTLRDWFAGILPAPEESVVQTQQSLDRSRNPHNDSHKPQLRSRDQIIAELRYRQADAMLAAREAK